MGEPQFHGFDIRGIGPRIKRVPYTTDANGNQVLVTDKDQISDDALGGDAYYLTRAELEIPLGAGARELGLRPSIYVQAGSLFSLTKPLPTTTFPTITDVNGKVTVLPIITPLVDSSGRQLYTVSAEDTTNYGAYTTCSVGYSSVAGGTCAGTSTNAIAQSSTAPFKEVYYGGTAKPRLSVGIGVNWTSPFGPLRIDIAKAILSQPGDDKKLVTFNVGTTF